MTKAGIHKKAMWLALIAVGVMATALVVTGFFSVWRMRFDAIGQRQKQDADIFASFIAQQLEQEIGSFKAYRRSQWWQDTVKEANFGYATWEPKAVEEHMKRMDEMWIPAVTDAPFVQERLASRMSQRLKTLAVEDPVVAEIFLTDRYGGLVAASNKTTDFYQADELWWQRAYHNGQGDVFVGELEWDASTLQINMAIAVPVKDETGQVIGVLKTLLDIDVFFRSLHQYGFGKTGHVALIDGKGGVIHHPGLAPMSKTVVSPLDLEQLLKNKKNTAVVTGCTGEKALVSIARVASPSLEANGLHWIILVSQDEEEVFFPLYRIFVAGLFLIGGLSFLIVLVLRHLIKSIFLVPLGKLQDGAQCLAAGDLDHRIDLKTADEFEILAEALNTMSAHLKQTMISRENLAHEIEQRNKMQQFLQESEKRFMDVLYASEDAILLISGDKFVDCNEATARMLGYGSREEFLMRHPSQLSPETQPGGQNSLEHANEMMRFAVEKGFNRFRWVHRKANGEDFPVQVSLTPIFMGGKEILHCVWIDLTSQVLSENNLLKAQAMLKEQSAQLTAALADSQKSRAILTSMLEDNNQNREELERHLKELKRSQNMLINSEKLASLGRLVSEIAHEVNNPLMIISGNAQLSLMEESISAEEKNSLEIIVKECQRAKNVIRRVLRFAKPSKGDVKEVDSVECLEGVVGIIEKQFVLGHNVHIKKEYLKDPVKIQVDEGQIQEVFMNLLNNAKEAMLKGGTITITTALEGEFLKIEFKDNGAGISEENMQKILEPFFTTKETGTGIGLAICYGIVKAHNGELRFESELGKGTTATILLPLGGG